MRTVTARATTGSLVIEYDRSRTGEPALLDALRAVGDRPGGAVRGSGIRPASAPPATLPSLLAFLASTGLLAATFLPLPGPVLAGLTAGSAWPVMSRAAGALRQRGRPTVEALDAITLVLLALRGNYRAAALLLWLLSAGEYLLERTVVRVRRSIRDLLASPEELVWRETGAGRAQVAAAVLKAGDTVVVSAGERVPVDGTVIHGEALVDHQRVTGEGLPVERVKGDRVWASTMVDEGEIGVRVEQVGIGTLVGRIIEVVEGAATEKPELQLFAEELADRQVVRSVGLAAVATVVTRQVDTGVAILVADYGTAVRVAIPVAAMAARIRASRAGILLKGPAVLERLARVDTVVFDKTGTLTLGTPHVARIVSYDPGLDEDRIVQLAAAAERGVRHPVAGAIIRLAAERRLAVPPRTRTEVRVGLGVGVRVQDRQLLVGSRRFMRGHGVDLGLAVMDETASHRAGGAPTFVALDGELVGLLHLRDELRPDARDAVLALRARNMRNVIMVSGDHADPTRVIAESLGVRHHYADLLPEEKAGLIRNLREEGRVVAMVGDGVNDALALARADVGIAVQGGAEVVAEAASVVLLEGGLDRVVQGLDIARDTMRQFRTVVDMSARANLAVIALASMGLTQPVTSILLSNGVALGTAIFTLATGKVPAAGLSPGRA